MMGPTEEELGTRGYDSITAYLTADHRRLDRLFDEALDHCGCGALLQARDYFSRFEKGLRRHIALEESTVFQVFLERTGIVGPIEVMRREHRKLEALIDEGRRALETDDTSRFSATAAQLRDLIQLHNAKEEQILYRKTDGVLGDEERRELAQRLARA